MLPFIHFITFQIISIFVSLPTVLQKFLHQYVFPPPTSSFWGLQTIVKCITITAPYWRDFVPRFTVEAEIFRNQLKCSLLPPTGLKQHCKQNYKNKNKKILNFIIYIYSSLSYYHGPLHYVITSFIMLIVQANIYLAFLIIFLGIWFRQRKAPISENEPLLTSGKQECLVLVLNGHYLAFFRDFSALTNLIWITVSA